MTTIFLLRCRYKHKSANSKFFSRKYTRNGFARIDFTKIFGNGAIIETFVSSSTLKKNSGSTLNIKRPLSYGRIILKVNTF